MSLSSDFKITLKSSKDYLRIAFLIHFMAIIVLIRSGFPLVFIIISIFILCFNILIICYTSKPVSNIRAFSRHSGQWFLHVQQQLPLPYERALISFDGGLFIRFTFTGISPKKSIFVFKDQMNFSDYRLLKILTKAETKKKQS